MALKNLTDPDNSETLAAATAITMLGGPMASDQVGQVLSTITGAIGLNPGVAGGVSLLYALFRLWKKHRMEKKASGKAAKAGAVVLACLMLGAASARADEHSVEVGAGLVNGEDTSGNGTKYSAGWNEELGRSGRFHGRIIMDRLVDLGDGSTDGVDAYTGTVDLLSTFSLGSRAELYVGGGLAGVWQDAVTTEQTVDVVSVSDLRALHAVEESPGSITVETEVSSAYLKWSGVGGVVVYFDAAKTKGIGFEGRYSNPMAEAENTLEGFAYLKFPAGPQ